MMKKPVLNKRSPKRKHHLWNIKSTGRNVRFYAVKDSKNKWHKIAFDRRRLNPSASAKMRKEKTSGTTKQVYKGKARQRNTGIKPKELIQRGMDSIRIKHWIEIRQKMLERLQENKPTENRLYLIDMIKRAEEQLEVPEKLRYVKKGSKLAKEIKTF